jgi:two-component system, LytTR family, sensor kinase
VADDGVGMNNAPASALRRTGAGIGMKNVQERLEVLYGNQASFNVVSNPRPRHARLHRDSGRRSS